LLNHTKQSIIGQSLEILPSVDSSNNYAMQQIHDGKAEHGCAYLALEQTGGKGQRGKAWYTGSHKNMALSIVLEPKHLKLDQQFLLTAFVAVVLTQYLHQWDKEFKIKWPNDIYGYDRKAAGMLVENNIRGVDWKYSVVGIGLNVNEEQYNESVVNGISLKQISGKEQDIYTIAKGLLDKMQEEWGLFVDSPMLYLERYNQFLFKKNELVHLKKNGTSIFAYIMEVGATGILYASNNEDYQFSFGIIEWVLD
jgi:BirA family transcriptional regulator, biotin operon repressor / biotin---[acetyl-CoA-carboxylase] ligase